jgi:hypothetical protein
MYEINCSHNLLTMLPSLPSTLSNLYCNNNQINNISVLPNSIISINCDSNLLTQLPALPPHLTSLSCNHNLLNSLPLFTAGLVTVNASDNQLNLINNINDSLEFLRLNNNINLSCLPKIQRLSHLEIVNTNIGCIPKNNDLNSTAGAGWQNLPLCTLSNPNQCASIFNINETHVKLVTDNVYTPKNRPIAIDMFKNDSVGIYSSSFLFHKQGVAVLTLNTYNVFDTTILPRLFTIYAPAQSYSGIDSIIYVVLDSALYASTVGNFLGAIYRYDTGKFLLLERILLYAI